MTTYYVIRRLFPSSYVSERVACDSRDSAERNLGNKEAYREQILEVEANNKPHAESIVQANQGNIIYDSVSA